MGINEKFQSLGNETVKAACISALAKANAALRSVAVLTFSGAGVNGDSFTLGGDVYELLQVNTDTTVNTANGELNNTKSGVLALSLAGQSVGRVLRVENEFLLVVAAETNSCSVLRGFAGSTIAAHANGVDIFGSAAAHTAGRKVVPVGATLTNTTVAPLVALAVAYHVAGYYEGLGTGAALWKKSKLSVEAVSFGSGAVGFFVLGGANPVPTTAESCANATITTFTAGSEIGGTQKAEVMYTVTADDVTAGLIRFGFGFAAKVAQVSVYTSAGVLKAWDGAVAFAGSGRVVSIDNAGATDWAAGDLIVVRAYG